MTGNETACKMGVFSWFVKSPSTQLLLTNESRKTHLNRRCWHFCWHFHSRISLFYQGSNDIRHEALLVTSAGIRR